LRGFIDLHCHWVAGIDDGAKTPDDGLRMLSGLKKAGFSAVVATPHMRPGMFENTRAMLEAAYGAMKPHLDAAGDDIPKTALASEHFLEDTVWTRLLRGEGLPYPALSELHPDESHPTQKRRGVLVEFNPQGFPPRLAARFVDLGRHGLFPVIAHPERYQPVWKDDACLDPLLDAGARLLLDACAVIGKYGRAAERAALKLLEEEAYEAACSDAHRPEDADATAAAIERLETLVGKGETERLLSDGPRMILGARPQ
jgi:protein-tyrosine phosphatase